MYNKGDFIVLDNDKNLYHIDEIREGTTECDIYVSVVNEYKEDNTPKLIEDNSKIVANLGDSIANTNSHVYRASTNLFQGRSWTSPARYIDYKTTVSPDDRKILEDTLTEVSNNTLFYNIMLSPGISYEIVSSRSRWVGKYIKCGKPKKDIPDKIMLNLMAYDKDHIKRVVYHELGHAIWNRNNIAINIKNKFIQYFLKSKTTFKMTEDQINNVRNDLLNTTSVRAYLSTLISTEESILKQSLGYIYKHYSLTPEDLDVLIASGNDLKEYFPTSLTFVKSDDNFVTKYASTNVQEFFCETFAAYIMRLPMVDDPELMDIYKSFIDESWREKKND